MKKMIFGILALLIVSMPVFAGWTEENGSGCKNDHYVGYLKVYTEADIDVMTDGFVNVYDDDQFVDVPIASSDDYRNGASCTAFTRASLINLTSTFYIADMTANIGKAPRNVTVSISSIGANVGIGQADTITGTLTIYGKNAKGDSTSEDISISTNEATGVVAWMTITTFTITISSASQYGGANVNPLYLWIGPGNKLGLSNDLVNSTDLVDIMEDTTHRLPGNTTAINTTYDTIDPQTNPDSSIDYSFRYKAKKK